MWLPGWESRTPRSLQVPTPCRPHCTRGTSCSGRSGCSRPKGRPTRRNLPFPLARPQPPFHLSVPRNLLPLPTRPSRRSPPAQPHPPGRSSRPFPQPARRPPRSTRHSRPTRRTPASKAGRHATTNPVHPSWCLQRLGNPCCSPSTLGGLRPFPCPHGQPPREPALRRDSLHQGPPFPFAVLAATGYCESTRGLLGTAVHTRHWRATPARGA